MLSRTETATSEPAEARIFHAIFLVKYCDLRVGGMSREAREARGRVSAQRNPGARRTLV